MNEMAHPSFQELAAFDRGELSSGRWEAVKGHVSCCNECCRRLEDVPADRIGVMLREAGRRLDTRDLRLEATPLHGVKHTETVPADIPDELRHHPRYRVLGCIGSGGMGAVFKAEHRLMERTVALKIIRRDLTQRPGVVERFQQEVKAAARLAHPNIVTAHDADHAGEVHFLVMEYVEGEALERFVAHQGPLHFVTACDYIRQAAQGLQHAHERGMIHRDIKPANLLLTHSQGQGVIKILDFGLARLLTESQQPSGITESGYVIGTPDFMAPEQASDPRRADGRADIYSLGCTLYFLLAGRAPFPDGTAIEKLMARQRDLPTSITAFRPDLPPAFLPVLDKLLAPDPDRRFQTPAEVVEALTPFMGSDTMPVLRPPRQRRMKTVASATLLLLVAATLGVALWPRGNEVGPKETETETPIIADTIPDGQLACLRDSQPFTQVAFSSDGREALTAGPDHSLQLWNLETGKIVHRFTGHKATVQALSISEDFHRILSGSADGEMRLWDLDERKLLDTFPANPGGVRGVYFTPVHTGRALSVGQDGNMLSWNLDEQRIMHTYRGHHGPINSVSVHPGNRYCVTTSFDRTARIWNTAEGRQVHQYNHDTPVLAAEISKHVYLVLTGCADHSVRLWRYTTEREVNRYLGHTDKVLSVALSRDYRWALSGSADGTARLWDLASGKQVALYQGHQGSVLRVKFCPDGQRFLSGGSDGTLRTWRLPVDRDLTPTRFSERINVVAQCPTGKYVAMARGEDIIEMGEFANLGVTLRGHTETVLSLAYSDDGKLLASGGWDHQVCLWNVANANIDGTRQPLKVLQGHQQPVRALAFSHDGQLLVSSGSDRQLRFWSVPEGNLLLAVPAHDAAVRDLEISKDDDLLVSCAEDGTIRLWDLAAWRRNMKQAPPMKTIVAHAGAVYSVSLSAKRPLLASGGADRVVILWDISNWRQNPPQKPTQILKQHTGTVWSVAFAPNGRTLASASADHSIQLWDAFTATKGRNMVPFDDEVYSLSFPTEMLSAGSLNGQVKSFTITSRPVP